MKFDTLTLLADHMQIYKYCIHQVAQSYGKTATFMPKPVYGDNGSGMHVHQSIWKDGKPLFAGDKYADLSQECLCTSAASSSTPRRSTPLPTRPPTPTSAWCRLRGPRAARLLGAQPLGLLPHPVDHEPEGQARRGPFPDPMANPYLAFSALLMAGLDGILNKIDPARPWTRISTTCPRAS